MRLFRDIWSYLRAVFVEGQRIAFTLFDVIGIVLLLNPQMAQGLTMNESLARVIGGAIFFLSFLAANFMLYRKLSLSIPGATARDKPGASPSSDPHYTINLTNVDIGEHGVLNIMGDPELTDKATSISSRRAETNTTIKH